MKGYMMITLVFSAIIALTYAQPRRDDGCSAFGNFKNGNIICDATAIAGMMKPRTTCLFKCNDKYVLNGPERIYCTLKGDKYQWLDSKTKDYFDGSEVECEVDRNAEIEDFFESTDGRFYREGPQLPAIKAKCAKRLCHVYYKGQTEEICADQGCCWNSVTNKCHAKRCTGRGRSQRGISSKDKCNDRGLNDPVCLYDEDESECYIPGDSITKFTPPPPKSFHWGADLLRGNTDHDTIYEEMGSKRFSKVVGKLKKVNIASMENQLTKPASTSWAERMGKCTFGGQATIDTSGKKEVNITLKYDGFDYMYQFSLSNSEGKTRRDMVTTMFTDFRRIILGFPTTGKQRVARKPHILKSGIKDIKLRMVRDTSMLHYSIQLARTVISGSLNIPDLFNSEEKFRVYMNHGTNWMHGFGLCDVQVDAS